MASANRYFSADTDTVGGLVGVADAVEPESATAGEVGGGTDDVLDTPGAPDPANGPMPDNGRSQRERREHRPHAKPVEDELEDGASRTADSDSGRDDTQEDRKRAAEGARGIGDAVSSISGDPTTLGSGASSIAQAIRDSDIRAGTCQRRRTRGDQSDTDY